MMEIEQKGKLTLEKAGFSEYKRSQFIRIENEIIFYISFQGRKKDFYIWYAVYPLCMPNISFSSGFRNSSGRYPINENELSINSLDDIQSVANELNESLKNIILPKFNRINSVADIAEDYLPWYPSAFAHFSMGNFEKGMALLNEYVEFRQNLSEHPNIEKEVNYFLENATKENISDLIFKEQQKNIKKLRLRKFCGGL